MLLALDDVPMWHNILASFFTYILLAGYIVFPATFKKFQSDQDLDDEANSELKKHALNSARYVPVGSLKGKKANSRIPNTNERQEYTTIIYSCLFMRHRCHRMHVAILDAP